MRWPCSTSTPNRITSYNVCYTKLLRDTTTRALDTSGTNVIDVGSLPDMLTFTHNGKKLLVANEGTPNRVADEAYSLPDPEGSVSISYNFV